VRDIHFPLVDVISTQGLSEVQAEHYERIIQEGKLMKKGKDAAVKEKKPERLGFKIYFGTTAMTTAEAMTAALMTSWFMVYLTDYAGIGTWAAALGSALLLGMRLFDAVNDPFQGWIMDRAKVGRFGKYKPFIITSILLLSVGVMGLFFIPAGFMSSPVAIVIWVVVFYLMYDVGGSLFAPNLIYKTITNDSNQRGKMMIGPRLVGLLLGVVSSSIISIVNGVNQSIGNMHTSFGITIIVIMGVCMLIALLGISLVKERYHPESAEKSDKVKLTDVFVLLRENKALRIRVVSMIFDGFIWTFLFATMLYYLKWAYSADLTTGVVNVEIYGLYSLIGSMLMFVPLIIGTLIAAPIMKKLGSAIRFHRLIILIQSLSCGLLFILQVTGLLASMPMIFFGCLAISAIAIGCGFIPGETVNIECMDYEIYKNGKDRSALCNACNKFVVKAQSAVATGVIGIILTGIGYVVDSKTDTYVGDLARIPSMLNWFIVIMGLVPFILGMISWFILRHYPVTDEVREDMKRVLNK
jgi:Na+/melibiose symporter-like transporter